MKGRHLLFCVLFCMLLWLFPQAAAGEASDAPQVEFYISHYISHVGHESSVIVQCRTPRLVPKDNNTFELRNQRGEVLAVKQWRNPRERLTLTFTVPQSALGGNELSLWWNGVDVTATHAYAAYSDLNVKRVTQLTPREPAIALTIVCGGGNRQDVADILSVLDKYGVKCTFFLSGGWLESHVEEARMIVAAGHEIGNHGYRHVRMTEMESYRDMRSVITKMNDRCETLLGVRPRLFRAPYSDTNQKVTALARAEGMEDVQWSIDSQDWADKYKRKPRQIIQRVTGKNAAPGAIIQFHLNGYNTPQVLDEVIPVYHERGWQVVTVGELLTLSGRELPELPEVSDAAD